MDDRRVPDIDTTRVYQDSGADQTYQKLLKRPPPAAALTTKARENKGRIRASRLVGLLLVSQNSSRSILYDTLNKSLLQPGLDLIDRADLIPCKTMCYGG